MSSQRYFLLGLFFLAAVGLLAYFTIFKSDLRLFGHTQEISVYFERANGLRDGDSVLVAGVRWGRVSGITYDPSAEESRRVVVSASLDDPLVLRDGYRIRIEEATLLGGRNLTIDPGPAGAPPLSDGATLAGTLALNPIQALGELVRDNEDAVGETIRTLRDLVKGLQEGRGTLGLLFSDQALGETVAKGVESASRSFEHVERITASLADGQGTLGRLLANDEVYVQLQRAGENLNAVLEDARGIAKDAREGRGTVGRLLHDEELGDDVAASVRALREIVASINRGEGTLGVLVRDDAIAKNLNSLVQRVADGQGSLGKLFTDDELYGDVKSFSENLAAIVAHIRSGRGSLGRIVMDEDLYEQIRTAVGLITRSLEEYREAAPISTMTSVIFGAF